jgi:hypothetical protein
MIAKSNMIDDFKHEPPLSALGTNWRLFTDGVMGGISQGTMVWETVAGRRAVRMRGEVSLENSGGFIQIALDLAADGATFDASAWRGIELDVCATREEEYSLRLRTSDLTKPWQSYRQSFTTKPHWQTVQLRFDQFEQNRAEISLDIRRLRRLGVVAIGRAFSVDLALAGIRFFA